MGLNEAITAMRNLGVSLNDYDTEALQTVISAAEDTEKLRRFVEDVAKNYYCDADAHRYNTQCRSCSAERLLNHLDKN